MICSHCRQFAVVRSRRQTLVIPAQAGIQSIPARPKALLVLAVGIFFVDGGAEDDFEFFLIKFLGFD